MLKVNNLRKEYKFFTLDNISFEIEKGMILGVLGANAAGKTTLIKLITNSIDKDSGTITYDDKEEIRDILAYHPADFPFNHFISIHFLLSYYENIYPSFDKIKTKKLLNKFGINPKDKIKNLSLGNKQKLMLALILSINAKIIILDEPSDGIDIFLRDEIISLLREHLYQNDAILIVATHQLEQYEDILDYVLYLENGKQLFYLDMIEFNEEANKFLENKLDDINLKNFIFQRQKEKTYD